MMQESNRILTFQTNDPDNFADNISPVVPAVKIHTLGKAMFRSQVQLIRLPRLGLFRVSLSNARVSVAQPLGYGSLTVPLGDTFETVTRGHTDVFATGAAYMAYWDDLFDLRTGDRSDMLVVNVDRPLLYDYIRRLHGDKAPETFQFVSRLSLETPEGASFQRYLSFVWNECTRDSSTYWSPLVIKEMEDALVVLLLNALDGPDGDTQGGEARGYPVYLKRAEDYILAHLEAPTSLADLTEVAGVSARTLARAFHQRYNVSPMGFLKVRRLEAAQRALLAADCRSTTVTDTALRFGFHHLGRFSIDYRKAFQESPSKTLRR